jgi:hypothetical protein
MNWSQEYHQDFRLLDGLLIVFDDIFLASMMVDWLFYCSGTLKNTKGTIWDTREFSRTVRDSHIQLTRKCPHGGLFWATVPLLETMSFFFSFLGGGSRKDF